MASLKKFNIEGKETGSVDVAQHIAEASANAQMVKDYLVALRNNRRQWSASTKGRSEVKHTTKKPFRQKGTGRARQGTLVAPHHRGGGVAFGPKPKFDVSTRINKKEKRAAIRFLIGEKVRNGKAFVLDWSSLEQPKTKEVINFLENANLKGKTLFIGEEANATVKSGDKEITVSCKQEKHNSLGKSLSNLSTASFSLAKAFSGEDIIRANNIVFSEEALKQIETWLASTSKEAK